MIRLEHHMAALILLCSRMWAALVRGGVGGGGNFFIIIGLIKTRRLDCHINYCMAEPSIAVVVLIAFVALCVLVVLYHLSSLGMFRHCCAENCGWFDLMIQGWMNNMTMGLYGVQKYFKYRDSKCVIR